MRTVTLTCTPNGSVRLIGRRRYNEIMKKTKSLYHGHRFPAVVISCAVRWYFRFNLSLRDIE
jgi:adenosylmethionine-8-amino-7-oxononanoate aminotransferase